MFKMRNTRTGKVILVPSRLKGEWEEVKSEVPAAEVVEPEKKTEPKPKKKTTKKTTAKKEG